MRRFLAAALLAIAFAASVRAEEALAVRIRAATGRAARAIAAAKLDPPGAGQDPRTLAALALVRGGGSAERPVARRLLDEWWTHAIQPGGDPTFPGSPSMNYELSLFVQAMEGLSLVRVDDPAATTEAPRFRVRGALAGERRARVEAAVRALVSGKVDTFDGKGAAWGYATGPLGGKTHAIPAVGGVPQWDNSNAQFTVLALFEAARGGVPIPKELPGKIAGHFIACARDDSRRDGATGGEAKRGPLRWPYVDEKAGSRPSMTFAGLSSLAAARALGARDPEVEEAIKRGLEGLSGLVRAGMASKGGYGQSYDLYSLEKALDLLELEELDGKPWFPPLAEWVLKTQGEDGLWNGDLIDSCFYVIFLARGTLPESRLVRSKGSDSGPGDVYLAGKKSNVNAVALLRAYLAAEKKDRSKLHAQADEAIKALIAEGHGRDACLIAPLAELARLEKDPRASAAQGWLKEVTGQTLTHAQADAAAASALALEDACDAAALAAALGKGQPLPVRAFAASEVVALQMRESASALAQACEDLASEKALLETNAGARCARAFADALTGLLAAAMPELPAKGRVTSAQLLAVAKAAREKLGG